MIDIYRKSIAYLIKNLPALIAFAALIEGIVWITKPKHESSVTLVPMLIVAYYMHRHFLFGENLTLKSPTPSDGAPPLKLGWFILASIGMIGIPIAISIAVILWFSTDGAPKEVIFTLVVLIIVPAHLLTLSLFGTALPAIVSRDKSYRLSAGIGAMFQTMWRLIAGPGVVGLGSLLVALAATKLQATLGIGEGSLIELAMFVLLRIIGFVPTIFAVAVLCDMYGRVTAGPETV